MAAIESSKGSKRRDWWRAEQNKMKLKIGDVLCYGTSDEDGDVVGRMARNRRDQSRVVKKPNQDVGIVIRSKVSCAA